MSLRAPGSVAEELARILRQRIELGGAPLVFEELGRSDVLARARAVRSNRGAPTAAATALPAQSTGSEAARRPSSDPAARAGDEGETDSFEDDLPLEHDGLAASAHACTRCALAAKRTQVVFSDGAPDARVMVVGEAPGANEDRTGLPFVGAAGKLLDLLLASVELSRESSVYICNVIKCRPPGNRNPTPDEIEACAPFLRRQIRVVQPEALLAVGTFAAKLLSGEDQPLGKLRGRIHGYEGIPLVVTYHPAALLRNSSWTRPTWDDLQLLRQLMDGDVAERMA